ncbi:MAG: UDP-N-acetylmuramoyl-L-alanine--D-glutamate ligase [Micromonosporaceae bacterium]|nr:UDP-N-acetylmuramoyl-L-alanine--D-glutamate ligase [Micromonosporaceae bacterium]
MGGWAGRPVVVAGAAVAGSAAAQALLRRGAVVTVVDRAAGPATDRLVAAGARVMIVDGAPPPGLLDGVATLVVSPGFAPHHPLVSAARAAGVEVYSEPELAWRLRGPDHPVWLAVTGTNGKTTTVTMLAAILAAAGLRSAAAGNIGEPLVDLTGYEVLAVELSSQQLHWSQTLAPPVGALLNLAPDHLEWHGSRAAYTEAKTAIWRGAGVAIGNLDDPEVAARLAAAPGRRVGFTLGEPAAGQLGITGGRLVDRAFGDPAGVPLAELTAVRPPGAHNLANALAAAAAARAYRVPPAAVADGLAGYQPQPHRNARVATVAGVTYVDDSKATNPHAALASLTAYPRVVWVAGGMLKGLEGVAVDELVRAVAGRLAGAVLLGADRAELARALARHAPGLPVVEVASTDDGAMGEVVRAAARLAGLGDTVLLAPAAASWDMFDNYGHRGDTFAAAVRALPPGGGDV